MSNLDATTTSTTIVSVEQALRAPYQRATPNVFEDALSKFSQGASLEALNLLEVITRNVVQRPEEERCRCLRTSNEKLAPLLGLPGAIELMQNMGWQEEAGLLTLPMDTKLDKFPQYVSQISKAKESSGKSRTYITGGVISRSEVCPTAHRQHPERTAENASLRSIGAAGNFEKRAANQDSKRRDAVGTPTEVEFREQSRSELRNLAAERRQRTAAASVEGSVPLVANPNLAPAELGEDHTCPPCAWLARLFGRGASHRDTADRRPSSMTLADLERADRQQANQQRMTQQAMRFASRGAFGRGG